MKPFVAAYVTVDGTELDRPICVENNKTDCKQKFYDWYKSAGHKKCTVRYAFVTVLECKEE